MADSGSDLCCGFYLGRIDHHLVHDAFLPDSGEEADMFSVFFRRILFQLYHNFRVRIFHSDLSQQKKDLDRLNFVLNYIAENYQRPISLDEIAGVAYLQTGYFCRFFKKKMGVTFLEYQNEYRLSFIYKDLINTKDPVHIILERHGFTNYKLFRRMFQEHFGCTPTKVRKNTQNAKD